MNRKINFRGSVTLTDSPIITNVNEHGHNDVSWGNTSWLHLFDGNSCLLSVDTDHTQHISDQHDLGLYHHWDWIIFVWGHTARCVTVCEYAPCLHLHMHVLSRYYCCTIPFCIFSVSSVLLSLSWHTYFCVCTLFYHPIWNQSDIKSNVLKKYIYIVTWFEICNNMVCSKTLCLFNYHLLLPSVVLSLFMSDTVCCSNLARSTSTN